MEWLTNAHNSCSTRAWDQAAHQGPSATQDGLAGAALDAERTIVIRDRRKPNQYTTDNVVAREWLPILRVGDAFFLYSVYLSMANRETESSWGSLRTQAEYLQCGVDLIIRGNRLLEICELLYIETRQPSDQQRVLYSRAPAPHARAQGAHLPSSGEHGRCRDQ